MPILKANGLDIFYDEFGDAADPAVLLIMGLGTQMIAWPQELCEGIAAQGYRVVRFDNRDNGLSQKLPQSGRVNIPWLLTRAWLGLPGGSPYTLDDMALDALGVMNGLSIKAAHIVGVSMGGMIAQIIAAKYPDRCLSLTSIMSSSGARGLPGPTPEARAMLQAKRPPDADRETMISFGADVFKVIASPAFPTPEAELRAKIAGFIDRSYYPPGMPRQLAAVIAGAGRARLLGAIRAPTLVLHGEDDVLVPVENGRDTARRIPNAEIETVAGWGHDLPAQLVPWLMERLVAHFTKTSQSDSAPISPLVGEKAISRT